MEELTATPKRKTSRHSLGSLEVLDDQLIPALDLFAKWGIKGIKVDFMQRDDQKLINFYFKVSSETANEKCSSIFTADKNKSP